MVSLVTVYAIAASGLFVIFILPVILAIWWRRRMLRAQKANANSILEATPTSVPGAFDPPDYMAPRPGGVNVELLLLDQNSTFGGYRTSISPSPSLNQKPPEPSHTQPPPPYTEV